MAGHTPRKVVHLYTSSYENHGIHHYSAEDEAVRRLAAMILLQSTADYVTLLRNDEKRKNGKRVTENIHITTHREIEQFVESTMLGRVCCALVDLEPETITEKMRSWKTTYERTGKIPTQVYKIGEAPLSERERSARKRERRRRNPCEYDPPWRNDHDET